MRRSCRAFKASCDHVTVRSLIVIAVGSIYCITFAQWVALAFIGLLGFALVAAMIADGARGLGTEADRT